MFFKSKKTRLREAACFTYDDPDGTSSWIFDLATNRLRFVYSPAPDLDTEVQELEIRREPNGLWSQRLTDAAWAQEYQEARADLNNTDANVAAQIGRNLAEGRLAELIDGPKWEPIPKFLQALVEHRYQAYRDIVTR